MRSELFEQHHMEQGDGPGWVRQSAKMLKVNLGPEVLAAQGAMVAYQGDITFNYEGSGSVGKFLKKLVTNEDTPLMRVGGQGDVFFARRAHDVFTMLLEDESITLNGQHLLAFDASIEWDINRVHGAGMLTGGLWNLTLRGAGQVALTCDGPPLILDCSTQPTFVDTQAAVCWSANLQPGIRNSTNMRSMLRGGTGEAFQYAFHGPGFVVVQPSEGELVLGGAGNQNSGGGLFG